ncbi:uncharacterized protein LOC134258306 isoform X1 [Saccostrea cucullata]|uniref:uncharacterized protein LOC134258306 isoform X1 n=1 Tax=Saccostrea cuccullata TaxID=36930 RepID=UPI002ED35BA7
MERILVVILISFLEIACHPLLKEGDSFENPQLFLSTTSSKVSSVLREILNQESLVRLSMVQKIQKLGMDSIDNKNITQVMKKRLDDLIYEVKALESGYQRMEKENSALNEKWKFMRSSMANTTSLTLNKIYPLNETEILLLMEQMSSLKRENDELTRERTEINTQLVVLNKTISLSERYLEILKNETMFNKHKIDILVEENESMQKKLLQMNETFSENNKNDLITRMQVVEGSFGSFEHTVNKTMENLFQEQNNFSRQLTHLSTQITERLKSPPSKSKSIAFYVYMSRNTGAISGQQILTFDVVKTNVGNGYYYATGIFIVPETGIYVFTWTIRENSTNRHSTQLVKNTDEVGIIHTQVHHDSDIAGTGIVVAHANTGDSVFVRTHSSWNYGIIVSNSAGRSSFAGWKIE